MKYFEVQAKCGHVGKNNFYMGTIYLWAEDARHAAQVARDFPRVKHDRKDAIFSVKEISLHEYKAGKIQQRHSAYWTSTSVQEQRENLHEIEEQIFHEVEKKSPYKKRHSLRNSKNYFDPLYAEFEHHRGNIQGIID